MSIDSQINRLTLAKEEIRNSIICKGVPVPEDASLSTYPSYIDAISQYGGGVDSDDSDYDYGDIAVRFFNTDGSILFEYTKYKFLQLGANPDVPMWLSYPGTWSLSYNEIVTYLETNDFVDVSVVFQFGETRIFITVTDASKTVGINIQVTGDGDGKQTTVYWGDKRANDYYNTDGTNGYVTAEHTYESAGKYIISVLARVSRYQLGHGNLKPVMPSGYDGFTIDRMDVGGDNQLMRKYALYNQDYMSELIISSNVMTFNEYSFYGTGIKYLYVTGTSMSNNTCGNCIHMRHLIFSKNLITISNDTCVGCTSLESVWMPDTNIMSIGSRAFADCVSLRKIRFSDSITSIRTNAFYNCTNLHKIKLPASLTSLDGSIFKNSGINDITVGSNINSFTNINSIPNDFILRVPVAKESNYSSMLSSYISSGKVTIVTY